jgi:hypothetical protein
MEIYLRSLEMNLRDSEIYLPRSEIYPEYLEINLQRPENYSRSPQTALSLRLNSARVDQTP